MTNEFKKKVLSCENICGTHLQMNNVVTAELLGSAGFDFIWIDTEHSPIGYNTLLSQIAVVQASGSKAIVRLAMNDFNHTKRVLEMGPDGVIFPMINTAEEADIAMRSCLYPPIGNRGFGPQRAVRYGLIDNNEYIENSDKLLCRFIQIETIAAVKNLSEIVKNPYIDGYIFGPCDLSGSIGKLNDVFGEETTSLIKEAIGILKSAGKCIGVSTFSSDPAVLKYWHELGINMISTGADYDYLLKAAIKNRKNIRAIQRND